MTYELENDVQIPPRTRKSQSWRYPFDGMEVGQSFFVSVEEHKDLDPDKLQLRLYGATNTAKKRLNHKYKVRVVQDEELGLGVRVWRVE